MNALKEYDPIEDLEKKFLGEEQVDCPVTHRFAPGVYLREIFMPTGTFIIGQRHNTKHFNVITKGQALVRIDGVVETIRAGDTFVSEPNVRKVLYIEEDMVWQTIHPTEETDLGLLEDQIITKSNSYLEHEQQMLEARELNQLIEEVGS